MGGPLEIMTFLEKYEFLKKSVPVKALRNIEPEGCEYSEFLDYCKNCIYCFESAKLIDSLYTVLGIWGTKLVDCTSVTESEKSYYCIDSNKCYNSTYLMDCNNCTDCHFSAFLNNCTDCFRCVAITHKKYCIFNKQYTKQEYFKKIEELKKENPEKLLNKMIDLKKQIPHPASQQFSSENCLYGNYIYNSKNSYWCFNSYYIENSGYNFISGNVKNSWDLYFSGSSDKSVVTERGYELYASGRTIYNCAFLSDSIYCTDSFYSDNLINCSYCFGCVGLKGKKYCILNNQLTKDQYDKAVKEIRKELGWKY